MKKKLSSIITVIAILIGIGVTSYAASQLFKRISQTSSFSKKTIFTFNLSTSLTDGEEVGPGDFIAVTPEVYNDGTENMYVFIVIDQPSVKNESLYFYSVLDGWSLVSETAEEQIFAYAIDNAMTAVVPGETTVPLFEGMTMKSISNMEYTQIDDINFTITAYALGIEGISDEVNEAWGACKSTGNIE